MDTIGVGEPTLPSLEVTQNWIRPYYRSFNGLRGVAVMMVFLCHFGGSLQGFTGQTLWVGVDLFFVLSGFLITGILYDSLESPHYFRDFYVRRALRIFPIFYGFFLILAVLGFILHLHFESHMLAFVFYFGNLTLPFADLTLHNPTIVSITHHGHLTEIINIGHLWSLCVEEQFYLIWPTVVWWVRDRQRLMRVCVIVSLLTIGVRFLLLAYSPPRELGQFLIHWSTYARCDTLVIGSWLALFLRRRSFSLVQLRRSSAILFWGSMAVLTAGVVHWRGRSVLANPFVLTVGFTLIALAAAGVLLRALDDSSLLSRVLRFRPLSGLGVVSYGFYFYHSLPSYPLHHLAAIHPGLTNVLPVLWFLLTAGIARLSFHYYETPFLRLKRFFSSPAAPVS